MNNLKLLRKEKKLLQKDIAKYLNMSQTGYSQYELETNDIPTNILRELSKFYNVSIDYLLDITNVRDRYSTSTIKINNTNRLREIREDKDMNQTKLAKIIGMSQTGYSAYEIGLCDIPTKVLKKLSNYYNVSIDYLLYMTDERKAHTKKKELITN